MQIKEKIYQIKIFFQVTPTVRRSVNVYLIAGKYCYLIDSGVAGAEKQIERYMQSLGRELHELKGIFLTHSHPDHVGAAAALKKFTNCTVYAPEKESVWIENAQQQFRERPIPNFHKLFPESVKVDRLLRDGNEIGVEEDIVLRAMETPGHSPGSMSFVLNGKTVFTGDAVPAAHDLPIFVDFQKSVDSIARYEAMPGVEWFCPAWEDAFEGAAAQTVLAERKMMLNCLREAARWAKQTCPGESAWIKLALERAGLPEEGGNPLVVKSLEACL